MFGAVFLRFQYRKIVCLVEYFYALNTGMLCWGLCLVESGFGWSDMV